MTGTLRLYLLDPANSFTVTIVFVALVRTAALEFFKVVFKNSMRLRRDRPAIPNSISAWSTHVKASAKTFGAFCLDNGSYAKSRMLISKSSPICGTYRDPTQIVAMSSLRTVSMFLPLASSASRRQVFR